ncbi:MAG: YjfB family protein [Zoogloeaceae bacterium]|nr:YjfB family protein [Zoogloeaceae bacterium]
MEISATGSAELANIQLSENVATLVLKKVLDIEAQNAAQLLQALPQPQYNNPAGIGGSVDTFV